MLKKNHKNVHTKSVIKETSRQKQRINPVSTDQDKPSPFHFLRPFRIPSMSAVFRLLSLSAMGRSFLIVAAKIDSQKHSHNPIL